MRPLPRLHAVSDASVLALPDLAVRARALAGAGPAIALHARDRALGGAGLATVTKMLLDIARPAEAAVIVNARPDVAAALGAAGVQLGADDLAPDEVRRAFTRWPGWIGASVHGEAEAEAAAAAGADYLLLGAVFETPSHPGVRPVGLETLTRIAARGLPVIAIGGITPDRAARVRDAGAWGVAAIRALWLAAEPGEAAANLVAPWVEDA